METVLYLDCETGGLDSSRHAIVQIAWIIERDVCGTAPVVQCERSFDVFPQGDVDMAALEVNGFDFARMRAGRPLAYVLAVLKADLVESCAGLGSGLVRPCGHNIEFDLNFLRAALKRAGERLDTYLALNRSLDTLGILRWYDFLGKIKLPSYKLSVVCKHFGITMEAHDAREDVRAVWKLFHLLQAP